MKLISVLILTLNISAFCFSQEKQIGLSYSVKSESEVLDPNLVFNTITGEKLSEKELIRLIRNNPGLNLEREYDAKGNIIRYNYNPNNQNQPSHRYPYSVAPKGKPYPNFIVSTLSGEQIELEKLRGKLVVVRFELYSSGYRFKQQEIEELDLKINALENKEEIESIIIFGESKSEIERGLRLNNSNFKLVPDGNKFFNKYQIDRFPITAFIDKEGKLIDYFKYSEDIDFKKHL